MKQFQFFVKYDDQPIAYGFHSLEDAEAFVFEGASIVVNPSDSKRSLLNCLAQITDEVRLWYPNELTSLGGEVHKGYMQDFAKLGDEWLACVDLGSGPVFVRQADLNRISEAYCAVIPDAQEWALMKEVSAEVSRFNKWACL